MILHQYYLRCLSHASYVIGDETTGRESLSTRVATSPNTSPTPTDTDSPSKR